MTEMGCDDPSTDNLGTLTDLTEFMNTLRAIPENEAAKPLFIYTKEDPWAFLKRLPKVTVRPNPYAVNELIERCKDRVFIDLYTERRQREKGETPKVDLLATEALDNSELIDLYQERRLRRRPV